MLDEEQSTTSTSTSTGSTGQSTADQTAPASGSVESADKPARKTSKKAPAKKATKKAAGQKTAAEAESPAPAKKAAKQATAKKTTAKKTTKKAASRKTATADESSDTGGQPTAATQAESAGGGAANLPLFQAPDPVATAPRKRTAKKAADPSQGDDTAGSDDGPQTRDDQDEGGPTRRRRSRGGRNRRKSGGDGQPTDTSADGGGAGTDGGKEQKTSKSTKGSKRGKAKDTKEAKEAQGADSAKDDAGAESDEGASSHRRRRRRRGGDDSGGDDSGASTSRARQSRAKKESITSVEGSTRIEAKKQRRREGREAGRRRPPILSESEFLARRESVDRVMAIRQRGETTQIAVLEDNVLVEHYVALESQTSLIGNVYLGRVQNVLPSMEAAFIDIGKGRNAVLYAGEVNWDLREDRNQPRRIENALKPGQAILVQVSKDPIGHKGARLTSQISLPGRYLVYVPDGGTSGISRKLADTERNRLKNLLKDILPDDAGVIIRTAAEGASEDELTRDVTRLTARWDDIEKKSKNGQAPQLLYAEPDTTLRVVRDLFTEDFSQLVISGEDAWDMVDGYVQHVAPDLAERLERYDGDGDVFQRFRIDEQITKALDRKVWLPSGGSLVIDRTEAMTVVDVNTGKFTGSGGNLEETVTKNNLEAAEEMVRQLRLRDIGGIIVIDFIDMVLENNRDLVLRRLVECLGRDRTRHQVAEVTSLGLVQMTRKRISTGLLEAFSHPCEHCQGRGVIVEGEPVDPKKHEDHQHGGSAGSRGGPKRSSNRRRGGRRDEGDDQRDKTESSQGANAEPDGGKDKADTQGDTGKADSQGNKGKADSQGDGTGESKPDSTPESRPDQTAADRGSSADTTTDPASSSPARGRRRRRASRPTGAPTAASSS